MERPWWRLVRGEARWPEWGLGAGEREEKGRWRTDDWTTTAAGMSQNGQEDEFDSCDWLGETVCAIE